MSTADNNECNMPIIDICLCSSISETEVFDGIEDSA